MRLIDCPHNGIGVHNCHHSADAGVRCQGRLCTTVEIIVLTNLVL